jgi:hypothetical protein
VNKTNVSAPAPVAVNGLDLFRSRPGLPKPIPIAVKIPQVAEVISKLTSTNATIGVHNDDVLSRCADHGPTVVAREIDGLNLVVQVQNA